MNRPDRRSSTNRVFPLVLLVMLAGGCAVDQKKEVATYRKILDGATPARYEYRPGEPLTLQGAFILANRNDEQLASSGEDYLQALIDRERQFSTFLPTISLNPAQYQFFRQGFGGRTSSATTGGVTTSTGTISSSKQGTSDFYAVGQYNVFNGFQDLANLRRAGYTSQQRRALLLDLQQTILLNVAQTYYSVLTNERSVQVLLNSAQVQNERVRDMEGRQRAGVARPLDVAQTEAQAAATRVQLIQAQNNVRTGRIALAFLTAAPVQDAPLADRLTVPQDMAPAEKLLLLAIRSRKDVQAAQAAVEAARQSVQSAWGQYYPSVTLNLEYILQRNPGFSGWTGTVSANVPIFTAGVIDANVRAAWSQLRQAWLNDQRTRRQVAEQMRTAYENLIGSKARISELRTEVAAARDALQQSQFSYQAGLATNLDVLTATNQLLSAQLSLVTEELNFKVYFAQLLRSEGRLARPDSALPPPGSATSQPADVELTTPGLGPTIPGGHAGNPATAPASNPATAPLNNPESVPAPASNPSTDPGAGPANSPAPTTAPSSQAATTGLTTGP